MGSGRKAEWWTETIDEFLVAMRSEAYDMVNAPDDAEDLHGDARSLAERFLALDDWLSSGRRRLPKSWWTTDAEQEGQS
jgi:hypothetical protein